LQKYIDAIVEQVHAYMIGWICIYRYIDGMIPKAIHPWMDNCVKA
jgi:hypothetical protein